MALTKRQKAYRVYLTSDHWKELRGRALERDGFKCGCGSTERLQVHHLCYRGRYEDSLLEDLETLCRKCHRIEHGIGPSDIDQAARVIDRRFNYMERPTKEEWLALRDAVMMDFEPDVRMFADLIMRWVHHLAFERHADIKSGWWTVPELKERWISRGFRVKTLIMERMKHVRKAL